MFALKTKIALATLSVFVAGAAVMVIGSMTSSQLVRAHAQSVVNTTSTVYKINTAGLDNEIAKPEIGGESAVEQPESKSLEKDLPGGHQDQNGVNVDHQFNGAE